jgi:hypothetical protein
MPYYTLSFSPRQHACLVILVLVFAVAALAQTPTQASCTYTFFPTTFFTPPLSRYGQFFPFGINDFRTVVGGAFQTGFIRWANGGFTFPKGTGALADRNDEGVSVGYDGNNNPIILNGTNITSAAVITQKGTLNGPGLVVSRINDWGSIVGWYGDNSGITHGYKRWANGHGFTLNFPAHFTAINSGTFPTGINDQGVIVGFTQIPYHAFVYYQGVWTTLRYPKSNSTLLWGISNAGVILGSAGFADGSSFGFLYKDGKFEKITPPGTVGLGVGSNVTAISLRKGLILGFANLKNSPSQGFIAKCK